MAVGWHEGSKPGQLYLAFSTDGGKDYRRTNGNLRKYPVVGEPALGMSVDICDGRVWAGTGYETGAGKAGIDVPDQPHHRWRRRAGAAHEHCRRPHAFAMSPWPASATTSRRRLAGEVRGQDPRAPDAAQPGSRWVRRRVFKRTYNLGPAEFKSGLAVAATPDPVAVAFVRDGHLRLKRFGIGEGEPPEDHAPTSP